MLYYSPARIDFGRKKSNLEKFRFLQQTLFLITAQKMKFSIKDLFSKCDQILSFQRIWSHLLKKSLMENFIFCAVNVLWFGLVQNIWLGIVISHQLVLDLLSLAYYWVVGNCYTVEGNREKLPDAITGLGTAELLIIKYFWFYWFVFSYLCIAQSWIYLLLILSIF